MADVMDGLQSQPRDYAHELKRIRLCVARACVARAWRIGRHRFIGAWANRAVAAYRISATGTTTIIEG